MTAAIEDDKISRILDTIAQYSTVEAAEFKQKVKERFGVNFPAALIVSELVVEEQEKQTHFEIVLVSTGDKKIDVLKAIRECFSYTLQECKDACDNLPHIFANGPFIEEKANQFSDKLIAAGARVQLK